MTQSQFQTIAPTLPNQPGIYKYFDAAATLLYVGKAKNLRKRVSSYFTKTLGVSYKTHELVQRIHHIEFTIVNSEQDAFLLENSLIKQFQPMFNINLKDDKTYPYIVIKKEPFPRIFLTRTKYHDGSEYLGPFTSTGKVRELLNFIRQNIPLRTCKLPLTESNIAKGKFKVCLEYHLGNCKGPCQAYQSLEDYNESIGQIKQILKGNLSPVIHTFKSQMMNHAMNMQFEKAELMKKKVDHLENYQARSVVVSQSLHNVDVFSILKEHDTAYVNYLMVQNGTIVQTHTVELEVKIEETDEEVLAFAVSNLRDTFNSLSNEVVVPYQIDLPDNIIITVPKAGDKRKLLDLSLTNVNYFKDELRKKKSLNLETFTEKKRKDVLYQVQADLQLSELPVHIECFDNSNLGGSYPVAAMVCFRNGIPSKDDYRKYNIKTVKGINDFASMKEVVYRRYKRLVDEEKELPQLVIIDGGKGQLSSAMESIKELGLIGAMTVVGLAKSEEEIFFPGDSQSIKLPWDSESLKLIRRVRDEVHRFGITFHRNKRSIGTFKNELEDIKGIGKQTAADLLKTFKSVKNVKQKNVEELSEIIGKAKANIVFSHYHTD